MMFEAASPVGSATSSANRNRPSLSRLIFGACGVWLIGLGLYFTLLRPPLLPEDFRYIGTSRGEMESAMPGLEDWTRRVFTVMSVVPAPSRGAQ